jgi:hypothetical protein
MDAWVGPAGDSRRYALASPEEPAAVGGQGVVYRATRTADGTMVALKQLHAVDLDDWVALRRRARLAAEISHPNLVRFLDEFLGPHPFTGAEPEAEEFDLPYLVTAWVDGEDLPTAIDRVPLTTAFGWVRDVGHAADALHRWPTPSGVGIVHRDIKPSNVRVAGGRAVLVDLGTARDAGDQTMTTGVGSPGWTPTEAWRDPGLVGSRSDGWQVAGLASWVVLRSPPGRHEPARHRRLRRALTRAGVRRAGPVARHIDRALSERVADRPGDVRAWSDALVRLTGAPRRRPTPWRGAVAVAVVLALLGAAATVRSVAVPAGDAGRSPVAGTPAVAALDVSPDRRAGLAFGQPVTVIARLTPVPHDGSDLRVRLVPLTDGGRTVPATGPMEQPVESGVASLTFTVTDVGATAAPVAVRTLELTVMARDGAAAPPNRHAEPVSLVFAPPVPGPERCTVYEPEQLDVRARGDGWELAAGPTAVAVLADEADARRALIVAREADRYCVIGRDPDARLVTTTHYWARGDHLVMPSPPAPDEDCHRYDPVAVGVEQGEGAGGVPVTAGGRATLLVLSDADAARRAAAVARYYRWQCFVGRTDPGGESTGRLDYWRG